MTKIFVFLIFIPLFACNRIASQKNGWAKYKVNGKVQEMLTKSWAAINKDGKIEPDKTKQIYYENIVFDSNGYITETYVEKINQIFISVYRKNSNDLLYYTSNPVGIATDAMDTMIYTNGKPDSIITKDKMGNVLGSTTLKLDPEGNIIERVKKNAKGSIVEKTTSEFKDGVCIHESVMDANNTILRITESEPGAGGRIKSARISSDKGEIFYAKFEYSEYDESDNWTKKLEYDKSGKVVRITKRGFMYFGKEYKK